MTRINLVQVETLHDQHLIAEYREMPMIGKALQRSLKTKTEAQVMSEISEEFTLNKGHVKFFYNKATFLLLRYISIVVEMERRGFKPDPTRLFNGEDFPPAFWNGYRALDSEIDTSFQRISERLSEKPDWYRKTPDIVSS